MTPILRLISIILLPWLVVFFALRHRLRFRLFAFAGIFAVQLFAIAPMAYIAASVARNQPESNSNVQLASVNYSHGGLLPYRNGESPQPLNELHSRGGEWAGRDYIRSCGTPIIAPFDGSVTRGGSGAIDSWDNTYMYIESNNGHYEMLIMHSDFILAAGDNFKTGQEIGKTNTHGNSSECHEHISLRVNGSEADPENYRNNNIVYDSVVSISSSDYSGNINSEYVQMIDKAITQTGSHVESELIMGIIQQESAWNPSATSYSGAMGLMQLMPGTASDMGVSNAYDPEQNIRGGVKYITFLVNRYPGDLRKAVMAYHAGPGNIENRGPTSLDNYYANQVLGYYEGYLND